MELTEILNWVFGGTSLIGVVTTIVFWRKTKRKEEAATQVAEAEADQSNIETQKQKIDLAELYKDKVLELMEQMSAKQDAGNANQGRILTKLERVEDKVSDIETYLNGPYHKWLSEQEGENMRLVDEGEDDHE